MEQNEQAKDSPAWKYGFFILAAVILIGAIYLFSVRGGVTGNVVANTGNQLPPVVKASIDDDAVWGNKDAKVTIVEFADYQCIFCRKAASEAIAQVKAEYGNQVAYVWRDFPLVSIHPAAQKSSEAAECVGENGDEAYWKMYDKIFAEQNILDGGSANSPVSKTVQYGVPELKKWAKDIGYDIDNCLDSGKYASEVQKDLSDGQALGVRGTPYFVINGQTLSGAQPFSAFKTIIDSELAK